MNITAAYCFMIIAIVQLIFAFLVTPADNLRSWVCFKITPMCSAIALALMIFKYTNWITINFL